MSYETQSLPLRGIFDTSMFGTSLHKIGGELRKKENTASIPLNLQNGDSAIVDVFDPKGKPELDTDVSFLDQDNISRLASTIVDLRKIDQRILELPNLKELIKTREDFLSKTISLNSDLYQGGEQAFAYSSIASTTAKVENYEEFEGLRKERDSLLATYRQLESKIASAEIQHARRKKDNLQLGEIRTIPRRVNSISVNGEIIMKSAPTDNGQFLQSTYKEPGELFWLPYLKKNY